MFNSSFNGGCTCEKNIAPKAASAPTRRQSGIVGPRVFASLFRRCPLSRLFFYFFELSTRVAFAKAAFDTLQVRLRSQSSVNVLALTEFWAESSLSSCQPIICVPKQTHWVPCRTNQVWRRTPVLFPETVFSKQCSAHLLSLSIYIYMLES